jgi:hypothetical protein
VDNVVATFQVARKVVVTFQIAKKLTHSLDKLEALSPLL